MKITKETISNIERVATSAYLIIAFIIVIEPNIIFQRSVLHSANVIMVCPCHRMQLLCEPGSGAAASGHTETAQVTRGWVMVRNSKGMDGRGVHQGRGSAPPCKVSQPVSRPGAGVLETRPLIHYQELGGVDIFVHRDSALVVCVCVCV